ncbi:DNA-binding protein [Mycobacterium sp. 236(2023)]|uniref:DNA-binding protein n=1 Tax=Mycobacterium sp. 236(2023) TaxID=3038163 RepID=UPI002415201C|nr:DNA-binding protein [Mycobacterium sp. 236(2023)]MDG4667987.1 DNA-binding protein [Mycobacterium sp. 236(2023)]
MRGDRPLPITTFSLAEVAAMVLPPEWKDPELWLMRRLRKGAIAGYKVGHEWRMTERQVEALIEAHTNSEPDADDEQPVDNSRDAVVSGLSARGVRRLL